MSPRLTRRRLVLGGAAAIAAPALVYAGGRTVASAEAGPAVSAESGSAAAATFPLQVYDNPQDRLHRRYLQDSSGTPFRVNADAAWFASTEFSMSDETSAAAWNRYLDDRVDKGFTALLMMGMVQRGYNGKVNGGPPEKYPHLDEDSANRVSGEKPLSRPGQFATYSEPYWANVAALIAAAADKGIAVLLAYNYLGYGGYGGEASQGWFSEISQSANGGTVMRDFGKRLAGQITTKNVIWYPYGDFNPPVGGEGGRRVLQTIEGIKEIDPDAIFAAELAPPAELPVDNADANRVLDINSFYGYTRNDGGPVYVTATKAWDDASRDSSPRPAWVCEPPYEGTEIGGGGGREGLRQSQWYSVLGGGTAGQTFGSLDIYCFNPGRWEQTMDSAAYRDMKVLFGFFDGFAWHRLMPSGRNRYGVEIVPQGAGSGTDKIVAAGTDDGTRLVAYVPGGGGRRTFTVDVGKLKPQRTMSWFDPAGGEPQSVETTGTGDQIRVTSPGGADWVLDIEAS